MYHILIAENVPSFNKGEESILEGMLEGFWSLGRVEVSMFSARPDIDQSNYGSKVKIIDIRPCWLLVNKSSPACRILSAILVMLQHLVFLLAYKLLGIGVLRFFDGEVWREYLKTDVIITGHNSNFGLGGDPETPFLYPIYLPLVAKELDKPCVLYGGTISKTTRLRWLTSKVFRFALNNMALITLRDEMSCRNARDFGIQNSRLFVTADPAFLLKPASPELTTKVMIREGIDKATKPLIGMTASRDTASLASRELSPDVSYTKHISMLAHVVDNLTERLGATVIFVPHCTGFGRELDDRIVAEDILQRCCNKNKVKVIANEYGATELKGLIGQFDLFIGERLHSVINSMSMGVPSVLISISTDQRLGIIEMLGQKEAICYVDMNAQALLSKIDYAWRIREELRRELREQTQIISKRAMLNGQLLGELLGHLQDQSTLVTLKRKESPEIE